MGVVRVGVSGWDYRSWEGDFYPEGLAAARRLAYAARRFDTIEINATFYRLASPTLFRRWRLASPEGFRFAVKGSRYITHRKRLRGTEVAVANFFASGILELEETLGPILWQLPADLRFDAGAVGDFLALLPRDTRAAWSLARGHDGRVAETTATVPARHRIRHVLEFRHPSFLSAELVRIARHHGVALAFSHSAEWPYVEELTAGFVYLRLHGPAELYASAYGSERLRRWAERIRAWQAGEEPENPARISARVPPPRLGRDVYVYFDNDAGGHAPREARELRALLRADAP